MKATISALFVAILAGCTVVPVAPAPYYDPVYYGPVYYYSPVVPYYHYGRRHRHH